MSVVRHEVRWLVYDAAGDRFLRRSGTDSEWVGVHDATAYRSRGAAELAASLFRPMGRTLVRPTVVIALFPVRLRLAKVST